MAAAPDTPTRRALVVVADPHLGSFTHQLTGRAASGLRAARYRVDIVDLHALGFRAAMSSAERIAYDTETPIVDPLVRNLAELVDRADVLVFVYPTVVSGLPAILKGWFDRVLVPGVAFRFDAAGRVRPALSHVGLVVGISTYDESRRTVAARNDNGRRTITRALRLSRGWRSEHRWYGLYESGRCSAADRHDFAGRIERELADLA